MSTKYLTRKQIEWAYEKYCLGYTQTEIGEALFVNRKTVQRALAGRKPVRPLLEYDFGEEKENEWK